MTINILGRPTMFAALHTLRTPLFDALRPNGRPVIVIAEALNGRTYIGNSAIGIYDQGIYKRLHPDWTCGIGEAAPALYDALSRECVVDEIAPVGFFTARRFDDVNQLAQYAVRAIEEQLKGIET